MPLFMKNKIGLWIILLFCLSNVNAQQKISFEELEMKRAQFPKNIVIKIQTNWCGICAIQEKKIQKNRELIKLLDEKLYYVVFDAESSETFQFAGKTYRPGINNIHEFAEEILQGKKVYPFWVIINPDLEIIFEYEGLLESEELLRIFEQIL